MSAYHVVPSGDPLSPGGARAGMSSLLNASAVRADGPRRVISFLVRAPCEEQRGATAFRARSSPARARQMSAASGAGSRATAFLSNVAAEAKFRWDKPSRLIRMERGTCCYRFTLLFLSVLIVRARARRGRGPLRDAAMLRASAVRHRKRPCFSRPSTRQVFSGYFQFDLPAIAVCQVIENLSIAKDAMW
jgi:hypothetical protein